jgi:hypothetical protein
MGFQTCLKRSFRLHTLQCLQTGVSRGADSAAGWLGLAELQYQERQYERSYQTGVDGCACIKHCFWQLRRRHGDYRPAAACHIHLADNLWHARKATACISL